MILDGANNVYIAASTTSEDFPTRNAAQTSIGGLQDGVVLKLNPDLSNVFFSTYLGGKMMMPLLFLHLIRLIIIYMLQELPPAMIFLAQNQER